jgi:hypothetical protein
MGKNHLQKESKHALPNHQSKEAHTISNSPHSQLHKFSYKEVNLIESIVTNLVDNFERTISNQFQFFTFSFEPFLTDVNQN